METDGAGSVVLEIQGSAIIVESTTKDEEKKNG
jgi:hypothetical protein